MFDLKDFVKKTILGMIENEHSYKVRSYSLGWYNKGVLTDDDMLEFETKIEEYEQSLVQNEEVITEEPITEEPVS